jgi:class 3 adenylate cyclase
MDQDAFRRWLAHKSWAASVRYCKGVAVLLPAAALATDWPLLQKGDEALDWLLAWQLTSFGICMAVIAADRWWAAVRGREVALYAFCAAFIGQCAWIGIVDGHWRGDYSIFAAGLTFGAAVLGTPVRMRQPLYAATLLALGIAAWLRHGGDPTQVVAALVNPFCVVVLCLWLDRITFSRDLALWQQTQRAQAERERADDLLHNVLPRAIAEELKRDRRIRARKCERLGVMFADIAGFTRYANRLPPDALVLMLDEIFTGFDALVERHGVEKIKTIGDAYMAVSEHGVDALCALALDQRAWLDDYNRRNGTQLAMRIGLHVGPAVAGVLGTKRFLYDVWGDTVNIASRVEAAGRAGSIHATDAVAQQAGARFKFVPRGEVELQGRGRMRTHWLQGEVAPGQAQPTAVAACA